MKSKILFITFLFSLSFANSQFFKERENKGRIFMSYGVNRAAYDISTIKLKGNSYDFELTNFDANDNYSEIDPAKFNAKIGVFITKNISLSLGYDNFTYKNVVGKPVKIDGTIDSGDFSGTYQSNHDLIKTDDKFISYEFTKLNYINFHCEINDDFWVSRNGKLAWSYYFGIGGGVILSESKISLFGGDSTVTNNGLSGFGGDINFGTRFYLGPLYLDLGGRAGYMKTQDVTTDPNGGKSTQNFAFASAIASVGLSFKF